MFPDLKAMILRTWLICSRIFAGRFRSLHETHTYLSAPSGKYTLATLRVTFLSSLTYIAPILVPPAPNNHICMC